MQRKAWLWTGASLVIVGVILTWLGLMALRWASQPKAAFEIPYRGHSVYCMRFSPDGRNLAVVTNENGFGGAKEIQRTRVYRVPDGKVVHEIENGAWMCAWNSNGSIFAVASPNGEEFDLRDAQTWVRKNRLSVGFSEYDKRTKVLIGTTVLALCFDHRGSLYTAVSADTDIGGNVAPFDRAKVWWKASDGKGQIKAEQLGTFRSPYDLSTAFLGPDTRVAISCLDPETPVEILRIRKGPTDNRIVQREYELSDLGSPHSESVFPAIRLTSDGQYLVVRTRERCRLYRLFDDHAELLRSREDEIEGHATSRVLGCVLDVSLDGRLAAYSSTDRAEVIRLPDGESLFEVRQVLSPIALSPDERLLAVADREQKSIRFYNIPQSRNN
jgi:WD40 repeat protein